ncbi:MAG TPA: tetratricopeptide repeat protein [Polyangiaceae bacterium]|nr:tetratricopeptide repeat protein [Polyangiaceae bacterium]
MTKWRLALTCVALASGCGGGPSTYSLALARAGKAERAADFDAARRAYAEASERAENDEQADEANYRAARLQLAERGPLEGAVALERFAASAPNSPRAARARLDAARAREHAGDEAGAREAYLRVVREHPTSSGAEAAARRWVALSGQEPEAAWARLLAENRAAELAPLLHYEHAKALEPQSPRQAVLEYEKTAELDPLPQGRYADEALLASARLRRREGDQTGALQTLDLLLRARDTSFLAGSYERAAYAEARWLSGLILRDDLARYDEAAQAFGRVVSDHPTSRRVDDALFDQAIAHALAHHPERACTSLRSLAETRPDSRFASCAPLFCPACESEGDAACQDVDMSPRCCGALPEEARPSSCRAPQDETQESPPDP